MARQGYVQGLQQSVRQEMALLPRMLQSIELLQLPVFELERFLVQAAEENEALWIEMATVPGEGRGRGAAASDRHAAWLESQPAADKGLVEHAQEQLGLLELSEEQERWARFLVRHLDANGLLSAPDETLLAHAEAEGLIGAGDGRYDDAATALGRGIAIVQALEPPGIGGRDAIEALLLQLDPGDPDYTLLCRLLEEFLEELARNKLPGVAKRLGVDLERLRELLVRLRELEPMPCSALTGEASPSLHPDVVVEPAEGGFTVRIDHSGLPPVSLDPGVQDLARDKAQPAGVRRYLRGKLDEARWLVESLEQRKRTLQRIATVVFEHQRRFLVDGPGHLVPLRMTQVAELLDVHVSTVSRGVAGKHVETPWGLFPLRHFFQAEAGANATTSREDVRASVRAIFEAEDPLSPLSDDDVAAELAKRGHEVARRTVAKYRKELGIPSSYRRRRYR